MNWSFDTISKFCITFINGKYVEKGLSSASDYMNDAQPFHSNTSMLSIETTQYNTKSGLVRVTCCYMSPVETQSYKGDNVITSELDKKKL